MDWNVLLLPANWALKIPFSLFKTKWASSPVISAVVQLNIMPLLRIHHSMQHFFWPKLISWQIDANLLLKVSKRWVSVTNLLNVLIILRHFWKSSRFIFSHSNKDTLASLPLHCHKSKSWLTFIDVQFTQCNNRTFKSSDHFDGDPSCSPSKTPLPERLEFHHQPSCNMGDWREGVDLGRGGVRGDNVV